MDIPGLIAKKVSVLYDALKKLALLSSRIFPGPVLPTIQNNPFNRDSFFDGLARTSVFSAFCPVLCSGNGIFQAGICYCHYGWKGTNCDVPSNKCEVASCNGHGQCSNEGECLCDKGYKGAFCEQRKFLRPFSCVFLPG